MIFRSKAQKKINNAGDKLETAVKEGRLDMPDAVNATRTLIEECRVMWK